MKKFLSKVAIFVIYALALNIILPVVIDPFNVFHVKNIRHVGAEPNRNYIKMNYILDNPKKFDGFMFGSSRVGAIHVDKISDEKIYNMTYSVGLPSEHLDNLKTFLANNIRPHRIFIGVDDISYGTAPEAHIKDAMRCPYEYLTGNNKCYFYRLYINPKITPNAVKLFFTKHEEINPFEFYEYGWQYDYNRVSEYDFNNLRYEHPKKQESFNNKIKRTLATITETVNLCRENNIELIIFTNPLQKITYMQALDRNYLTFLEGLAQITDFYNFSGLNDITLDDNNYLDWSHYKAEIGDMIINVICNGIKYPELNSQGFGVKVTRDNVKDLIRLLEEQAADFKQKNVPGI